MSAEPKSRSYDSDDLIGKKWDQCVARWIVNSGIGIASGVGLSVVLFRRRFWPVAMAFGFASGISYAECRASFSPANNLPAGSRLRYIQPTGVNSSTIQPPLAESPKEASS